MAQRQFFFWYKPEERASIERELRRIGRPDLISKLYDGVPYHGRAHYDPKAIGSSPERTDKREKKRKSFNPNFQPRGFGKKTKKR